MASPEGYSRLQIALHWAVAGLMGLNFVSNDAMKAAWWAVEKGRDAFGNVAMVHVASGSLILVLGLLRLAVRLGRGAPAAPAGTSPMMALAARSMHAALYGAMILIPLAGLVAWFGGVRTMGEVHETLFAVTLGLVGLHVLAAAVHHWVLRDGLLLRMWRAR